ncbi:DUF2505 family protein [Corynebacterium sp.]|mgnify:CR=1 FL=1|uniref:DUF2505 family protein n=1 Tax=Corynebacterium sp. TaxID=1720 RepID=UPI0025C463ED|nr:DUF2505 family protein [Corynebacterium sp.]
MRRSAELTRTVDLPLEKVHEIASSETYLLTVDDASTSKLVVTEAERQVDGDGSVHARVVAAHQKDDGSAGFSMEQVSDITAVSDDGFVSTTVTPLPKGIGSLTVVLGYTRAGESSVTVNAEIIADVGIPLLGGKIAKKLVESADKTVDSGLDRIRRLAAG